MEFDEEQTVMQGWESLRFFKEAVMSQDSKWKLVDLNEHHVGLSTTTARMKVEGGWLYREVVEVTNDNGQQDSCAVALVFVKDEPPKTKIWDPDTGEELPL